MKYKYWIEKKKGNTMEQWEDARHSDWTHEDVFSSRLKEDEDYCSVLEKWEQFLKFVPTHYFSLDK